MIPWKIVDRVQLPDGGGELSLHRRGEEFSIRVNGLELMNSLAHESEEALAGRVCERIAGCRKPRVLIGGLGMGFTLAEALRVLASSADVVVAELISKVVEWNGKYLADLTGDPLGDERVTVREIDVAAILKEERNAYDAVLLDVDNGPEGFTRKGNDWLYSRGGLCASFAALRFKGILAVWSVASDEAFSKRLEKTGFKVEELRVRSKSRHGTARHTIWIAEKT